MEEKKLSYQYIEINPYSDDKSFLKVNKRGMVPAIQRNGISLSESEILLEYLDDAFPDSNNLFPSNPEQKALTRMTVDFIEKKIVTAFLNCLQAQDPEQQQSYRKDYVAGLRIFAKGLPEAQKFHGGSRIDAADINLAPWAAREYILEDNRGGPFKEDEVGAPYMEWKDAILQHSAVVNTMSEKKYYTEVLQKHLSNEAQSQAAKATRDGTTLM